ncbi:TonB-dependent siderophore receptor [Steroidobacter sp.]|uniref:TonB-dependent siderophore receptor n=1 Tax=Steroidobacter sp. TaxID=1978227 RepID=UPI001A4C31DF|nr:TonB-dependent receptor [Steroidobacter sp.]MBL8267993.1 TonB-dependent receptor [Steroidobacter sp.]
MPIRARQITTAVCCALAAVAVVKADVTTTAPFDTTQSSLSQALKDYALTFNQTIIFSETLVAGMKASSLKGNYTADTALAQLLRGTGLIAEKNAVGAVVIRREGESKPTADAAATAPVSFRLAQTDSPGVSQSADTGTTNVRTEVEQRETKSGIEEINVFGRRPDDTVKDIPQSITVFNREVIDISPSVSVGDMIRFIPTASRNGSTLNAFGDNYIIRGFDANQTVNGLGFNRIAHARDIANVERIEVLKGPASVLFGQMQPGAVINVVTKQPLDHFYSELGLEYGKYNDQRYTLDITGPISDRVRARLNVAYREADAFVDFWDLEHLYIAPNVTVDLTSATTLTVEGTYSTNAWGSFQNGTPAEGLFLPNPNGKYRRSFNPDEPNIGHTDRDSMDANVRLVHEINDTMRVRASYTYTRNEGDFTEMFVAGLRPDMRTIDRFYFHSVGAYENDDNYLVDLVGELQTGPLLHKYLIGANYRNFDSSRPARFVGSTPLDLFNPVYGLAPPVNPLLNQFFQNFNSVGYFLQDRISVGGRWHFLVGVRYTDSHQDTKSVSAAGATFINVLDEQKWTPQFGVLFEVTDRFSVYANRTESFVPQFGTTSGGTPFESQQGMQYELGTRFDIGDSGLQANAAVFIITKDNLQTSDPSNPGFSAALGEVESRGFEMSIHGHIRPNWFLGAAYGYTDTEVTRDFDGLKGLKLRNAPNNTMSVQTRYDIGSGPLRGLGLGGTVEYVDSRYGDDANTFEVPKHTRVDLGAYYPINERMQLDLLVNNVLNEDMYAEAFELYRVIPEPGRTYMVRFKLRVQ